MNKSAEAWSKIMKKQNGVNQKSEPEYEGSVWKHPYMFYIFGTILLFIFLLGMGYMAIQNDWIPSRGIGQ